MRFYRIDLLDFHRGTLSARRLQILIRHLPAESALVTALNSDRPQWSITDHLLADLWALIARVNSPKGSLPDDFDNPRRAEITAAVRMKSKMAAKARYLERKRERQKAANPVVGVTV